MKGSIIERGNSFRLKVSLGRDPQTGKYTSYYETCRGNKTDAQKRLRELLTQIDKGTFCRPGKVIVGEYLKIWLSENVKCSLSPRTFELYSYLCQIGLPELSDNDLVFSHHDGSPLLPDTISHAWRKLARRCGLTGIRLHDARHTHATTMLKQGVHPKIVQERLGHSNISTTLDTYSHVTAGLQQAAANGFDTILNKESKLDKELTAIIQD